MERYNVTFRYTSKAAHYEGVIIWTSFDDKASFDTWYDDKQQAMLTVVEEGVSEERCIELAQSTPNHLHLKASIGEFTEIITAILCEG